MSTAVWGFKSGKVIDDCEYLQVKDSKAAPTDRGPGDGSKHTERSSARSNARPAAFTTFDGRAEVPRGAFSAEDCDCNSR